MKRCFNVIGTILLLLLCLFTACNSKKQVPEPVEGPFKELSVIDSLMWRQPDSAFVLLQGFVDSPESEELDTFDGHYCQLLISELLYKKTTNKTLRASDYILINEPFEAASGAQLTLMVHDCPECIDNNKHIDDD